MRGADTNIVVRLLTRDDSRQAALADAFVKPGAWVSILVIAETIWVLSTVYGRSSTELGRAVEELLGHRDLVLQDPDVIAAALETFRSRPSLSFSDCLILQIARKAGHLPLGTFDRTLGKVKGTEKL
jgi:predicted nucleic-acid-binding protein